MFQDHVDLITCTNLDRAHERWRFMLGQFERENLTGVHRIAAADGTKPMPLFGDIPLETRFKPNTVEWNHGVAGSVASMCMALAFARFSGARSLLYLEDDAVLPVNFKSNVDRVMQTAPPDWDIINFGPWHYEPAHDYDEDWVLNQHALNAHCWLIRRQAFDTIDRLLMLRRANPEVSVALCSLLRSYSHKSFKVPQRAGFSYVLQRYLGQDHGRLEPSDVEGAHDDIFAPTFLPNLRVRSSDRDADLVHIDAIVHNDVFGVHRLPVKPTRVIDVGARAGEFAWLMYRHHPDAMIRSVETERTLADCYKNNHHHNDNYVLSEHGVGYGENQDTIEDILQTAGWSDADLLKIDGPAKHILENLDLKRVRCIVVRGPDAQECATLRRFRAWGKDNREVLTLLSPEVMVSGTDNA